MLVCAKQIHGFSIIQTSRKKQQSSHPALLTQAQTRGSNLRKPWKHTRTPLKRGSEKRRRTFRHAETCRCRSRCRRAIAVAPASRRCRQNLFSLALAPLSPVRRAWSSHAERLRNVLVVSEPALSLRAGRRSTVATVVTLDKVGIVTISVRPMTL